MESINNLKGTIVKDGSIVYSELLDNGLYFVIILMYESTNLKSDHFKGSSKIVCNALISNNQRHTYANGAQAIHSGDNTETVLESESFADLVPDTKTKDGFKVFQVAHNHQSLVRAENGISVSVKCRSLTWCVEVPKLKMLEYCKIN